MSFNIDDSSHNDSKSASLELSDEEEVEPKFKYVRMTNYLQKIISEDTISCVNVASRVSDSYSDSLC